MRENNINIKPVVNKSSYMGVIVYRIQNISLSIGRDTICEGASVLVRGLDKKHRYITEEEFETVVKVLGLNDLYSGGKF